jgi:hypothetical protein
MQSFKSRSKLLTCLCRVTYACFLYLTRSLCKKYLQRIFVNRVPLLSSFRSEWSCKYEQTCIVLGVFPSFSVVPSRNLDYGPSVPP